MQSRLVYYMLIDLQASLVKSKTPGFLDCKIEIVPETIH